jgi:uncharacterized protein YbjT (DUF2867 family)
MYVIAGVTGHVGSVVAGELIARGKQVKVIARDANKARAWSVRGAEVAVGSLEDEAFLTAALRGATGFFALLPPNLAEPDYYGWQRRTGETVARAVKASGVPHVVMLSSVGADLASGNGPIRGLHHLENALRATGARVAAIRAGYFMENVGNSLGAARQAGIFPNFMASSDYPLPMIATKDIGRLAAESLLAPAAKNEVIDLAGSAYSIRQVAEKLGAALGKQLNVVDIPQAGWIPAMVKAGLPQHLAEVYADMYAGFNSGIIQPKGDRAIKGATTLDEVIPSLIAGS